MAANFPCCSPSVGIPAAFHTYSLYGKGLEEKLMNTVSGLQATDSNHLCSVAGTGPGQDIV